MTFPVLLSTFNTISASWSSTVLKISLHKKRRKRRS